DVVPFFSGFRKLYSTAAPREPALSSQWGPARYGAAPSDCDPPRGGAFVLCPHTPAATVAAMGEFVNYEVDGDGIAVVTINRPEKRNAMTYAMLGDFIATVHQAGDDDAARVVIVTGSGGSFCAGTDLSDLSSVPGEDRGVRGRAEQADVWWPLTSCP